MTSVLIARLRSDLAAANFSVTALTGLWGVEADAALQRNQRVPARRGLAALQAKLGRVEPSATLAELFVLGLSVAQADLAAALPTLTVAGAEELGLVSAGVPVGAVAAGTNPSGAAELGLVTSLVPAGAKPSGAKPSGADPSGAEIDSAELPASAPFAPARVRPLVELRPYSFLDEFGADSWWIVSDLGELALGRPLGESHVLGIGGASRTLSGLIMPTPAGRVLDLGTGCGIQAMHASRHAEHVVATDISERALELAALNAALNGIDTIEFRLGSLFEPVAGERFDHIISNPPFVITPRTPGVPSYEYRDGGMVGDALVEAVVRGAAAHLNPGGVAQLLGNWEYRAAAPAAAGVEAGPTASVTDAFARLESWLDAPAAPGPVPFDGDAPAERPASARTTEYDRSTPSNGTEPADAPPLDAWVIEREVQLPSEYAETWIRDGGTRPGPDFDRLYTAWLDDFAARGVTRVGFGYLLLRLPATPDGHVGTAGASTLRRLERLPDALGHNPTGLGSHLAACLAAHDWQAAMDDARLLRAHLTVASDVTEERHFWPGQDDPTLMTLHQGGGFGRKVALDTALAALIGACDGDLNVGAIIGALAQLLDADEGDLSAELLPRVRELLDDGFLLPPA
ncbi:DUF7059 domain-containing protein [Cryobacterium melibiosiphilum]|uniref:DUF7059 domain-containing protein n=1 Tax=Cryobacterium melibiosiphilum TaxID=995039 RepID=UPI001F44BA88|nr:methyltransferase [Cryobacterium melibiosiphilum]